MSLVGNRPLPVYEAETLTKDQLSKRFLAPAGITGLWQVELRGKGGNMSEEERIELDNKYADYFTNNNYSFWLDIKNITTYRPSFISAKYSLEPQGLTQSQPLTFSRIRYSEPFTRAIRR